MHVLRIEMMLVSSLHASLALLASFELTTSLFNIVASASIRSESVRLV